MELRFETQQTSGHISEEGDLIQAERLDDLLKGEEVTFIKMDIEGAEVNALLGAEKIDRKSVE